MATWKTYRYSSEQPCKWVITDGVMWFTIDAVLNPNQRGNYYKVTPAQSDLYAKLICDALNAYEEKNVRDGRLPLNQFPERGK